MDMKAFQVLSVLLLTAAAADGQFVHLGTCPRPPVQKDFDFTKYFGTWYQIEKLPTVVERGKCARTVHSPRSDTTFHVHKAELLPNGLTNFMDGVAKVEDPSQPGYLTLSLSRGIPDSPYMIISTDYQTYCLVYSCLEYFGLFHFEFAWILARTRTLHPDIVSQLRGKLAAAGVNITRLTVSDQTGCDGMV